MDAKIEAASMALGVFLDSQALRGLVLKKSRVGMWKWDLTNNELLWCDVMLDLFDVDREEFNNDYESFASRVSPEDLPRVEENIRRSIEDPEYLYNYVFRVKRKDGRWHKIHGCGSVIRVEGTPVSMVGVCMPGPSES